MVPVVDSANKIAETNEANNGGRAADVNSVVTITPARMPSLAGTQLSVVPVNSGQAAWGGTLQVTAQFSNMTPGTVARETRARLVLAPAGVSPDDPQAVTVGELRVPAISGGTTATVQGTVYLSRKPPAALSGQTQFSLYAVADADFAYRPKLATTVVRGDGQDMANMTILTPVNAPPAPTQQADLSVKEIRLGGNTVTWSQDFEVRGVVQNTGTTDSGPFRVRFVLGDSNRPYASPLALADTTIENLAPGYSVEVTQMVRPDGKLPDGLQPENIAGRIVVMVDAENTVLESNETNNGMGSVPVRLRLLTKEGVSTPTPTPPVVTPPTTPTPPTQPTQPTRPTTPPATTRALRMAELRRQLQEKKQLRVHQPSTPSGPRPSQAQRIAQQQKAAQARAERQAAMAANRAEMLRAKLRKTSNRLAAPQAGIDPAPNV